MYIDEFLKILIENFFVFWVSILYKESGFSSILYIILGVCIIDRCIFEIL